jgi:hypothetical protein
LKRERHREREREREREKKGEENIILPGEQLTGLVSGLANVALGGGDFGDLANFAVGTLSVGNRVARKALELSRTAWLTALITSGSVDDCGVAWTANAARSVVVWYLVSGAGNFGGVEEVRRLIDVLTDEGARICRAGTQINDGEVELS